MSMLIACQIEECIEERSRRTHRYLDLTLCVDQPASAALDVTT